MKLQNKLILFNLFAVIFSLSFVYFISHVAVYERIAKTESREISTNIERLKNSLNSEKQNLAIQNEDWAYWDDTYNFILGIDPNYEKANLGEGSFENLRISAIIFLNNHGQVIYIRSSEDIKNKTVLAFLNKLNNSNLSEFEGIISLDNNMFLVSSKNILKSNKEGPPAGKLIMIRDLNLRKKNIESYTQLKVEFLYYDPINQFQKTDKLLDYTYINKSENYINIYLIIKDIFNEPIGIIKTELKRNTYIESNNVLRKAAISLFIFGFILSLCIFFFNYIISKRIINPINSLINYSKNYSQIDNKKFLVSKKSEPIVTELSESIVNLLNNIESKKEEIERLNKNLEKKVNQRTRELKKKINEMEKTKKAILNLMEDMSIANEELKKLDKAKSEFLNIVSHELKTPLTALIAHLEIISESKENLNQEQINSLEAIKRNTDNLKMLISNILEIARMESGKFELTKVNGDLNNLIRKVIEEVEILAKQKNLNLIFEPSELPNFEFDDTRLKEVMNNLLTNAIKFTEKGEIKVTTRKVEDKVVVSVKDTGVGIPKEKIKNLFQKFYQVEPSLSRRYGGTGLGLAITKKIIEAHEGQINIYSEGENKGTEVVFSLKIDNNKKNKNSENY